MKPHAQRAFSLSRSLAGWACVALGILGILLPLLPGIPLLIAGLAILSTQHRWIRGLLLRCRRRFAPLLRRRARRAPVRPPAR